MRCAASAEEAFAIVNDGFTPFAVLCDQRLRSGESGFDILKALFERLPDVSGAMVSGEFNSQILQEAEQEGYLVLRKPLEPAGLHALLTQWGRAAHIEGYQAMISRLNSNCWISCRCDKIACAVTNLSSTEYKTR